MLFLPFFVPPVHQDDHQNEDQDKQQRENHLSRAEHLNTFEAKLNQFPLRMKRKIQAVAEFHQAFGLGISSEPTAELGMQVDA